MGPFRTVSEFLFSIAHKVNPAQLAYRYPYGANVGVVTRTLHVVEKINHFMGEYSIISGKKIATLSVDGKGCL